MVMVKTALLVLALLSHTAGALANGSVLLCRHSDGQQYLEWAGSPCCATEIPSCGCPCESKQPDSSLNSACCTDSAVETCATRINSQRMVPSVSVIDVPPLPVSHYLAMLPTVATNMIAPAHSHDPPTLIHLASVVILC